MDHCGHSLNVVRFLISGGEPQVYTPAVFAYSVGEDLPYASFFTEIQVGDAAKRAVRQAAAEVKLNPPDLSPQTDGIADKVAAKVVSQMDDRVDKMISRKTVKIKVEHTHHHQSHMFTRWASSETNRKTMCVLAGIIAVLAIAIDVILYWYFHSPQYAIKLYHDVKTHPYQAGDIKKNKDHGLDLVYKRRDEGKLDGYIDALEEAKKELNQDKLIWWW